MALARSTWTSDADFWTLTYPQVVQGFGMSFFMLPLTVISLNSVEPDELASATGIQNFVRTIALGVSTALALTYWGNAQQEAHAEIAGKLQPDEVMRTMANAGMSSDQALRAIANLADRESVTMAIDAVFLVTAAVFFLSAAVVWLAPRPKVPGMPGRPKS